MAVVRRVSQIVIVAALLLITGCNFTKPAIPPEGTAASPGSQSASAGSVGLQTSQIQAMLAANRDTVIKLLGQPSRKRAFFNTEYWSYDSLGLDLCVTETGVICVQQVTGMTPLGFSIGEKEAQVAALLAQRVAGSHFVDTPGGQPYPKVARTEGQEFDTLLWARDGTVVRVDYQPPNGDD